LSDGIICTFLRNIQKFLFTSYDICGLVFAEGAFFFIRTKYSPISSKILKNVIPLQVFSAACNVYRTVSV